MSWRDNRGTPPHCARNRLARRRRGSTLSADAPKARRLAAETAFPNGAVSGGCENISIGEQAKRVCRPAAPSPGSPSRDARSRILAEDGLCHVGYCHLDRALIVWGVITGVLVVLINLPFAGFDEEDDRLFWNSAESRRGREQQQVRMRL